MLIREEDENKEWKIFSEEPEKGNSVLIYATVNDYFQLMRYHCLLICNTSGIESGGGALHPPLLQSILLLPTVHIHLYLEKGCY